MTVRVAIDAMGGDFGVDAVIGGVQRFVEVYNAQDVEFDLYGDCSLIEAELSKSAIRSIVSVTHCEKCIDSAMAPAHALRFCTDSSMCQAIKSIADGKNDAVVSAGNTGAYMAFSKTLLHMIDDIERPALVSSFPRCDSHGNVVLDLGANTECSADMLFQFAVMGNAVAKAWFNIESPKIGLLNIGTEVAKGTSVLKETYNRLKKFSCVNFIGFVEGFDLTGDKADVIVTDGFSGNIALKATEGTVKFIANVCKSNANCARGKLAYLLGKQAIEAVKAKIDPQTHNGAALVGLNGIAVKSHGSADSTGIASAIGSAVKLVRSGFVKTVKECINLHK